MSFTAEEYRTAAKVIRAEFNIDDAGYLEAKARKLQARERYARQLVGLQVPGDDPTFNGAKILGRLLSDGWAPPEGLF